MLERYHYCCFILAFLVLLTGCTHTVIDSTGGRCLPQGKVVAVLPFNNLTETPQANERASAIVTDLLRAKGANPVINYPLKPSRPTLIPTVTTPIARAKLIHWASNRGIQYVFMGSVTEWTYKVGLDGEPVVGVTIELIDTFRDQVIWNSVGSKSGGSRTAVSTVAQDLIEQMLSNVKFGRSRYAQ